MSDSDFIPGLVSMVLVNWNGKAFLEKCIPSILSQTYSNTEFLIIDNASKDGSVQWLTENFPQVKLIQQQKNLGYAAAHNIGIRLSQGQFYMPLNCDLVLCDTFVEQMYNVLQSHSDAGTVSGKLLKIDQASRLTSIIDSTGHLLLQNRVAMNRGENELNDSQYETVDEIFGASGTAPMYQREMLESIKIQDEYFDEDFFAYWEDVDLDWRAYRVGWKAYYAPKAQAYHFRNGTYSRTAHALSFRNRYLTLIKNDELTNIRKDFLPFILFEYDQWEAMIFNVKQWYKWKMVPSTLKLIPRAYKKRRQFKQMHSTTLVLDLKAVDTSTKRKRRCIRRFLQKLFWTGLIIFILIMQYYSRRL